MQYDQFFAGEYQITKTLERSQYSVLCQGKKLATGQEVLLRLWLTAQVDSEEVHTRILEEVADLQHVSHPHLLSVLGVQADAQKVFLVSEDAPAGSLNERLGREGEEALSLTEALQIIEQSGQALQELHAHNIIHGNLTPQAIFFSSPGQVKLGEFLVRSVLVSIQDYQHALDENVPRCFYMAPEQFRGTLDQKTDQYALGCLAYVLLTGRVPFAGSSRSTLLQKHQNDEPPDLTSINPMVPEHIEAAVLKALSKAPDERHSSIQVFLEALDATGKKVLADQNTVKQLVPGILLADGDEMADGSWEWEVAVPPDGPLEDSGPTRAVGGSSRGPLLVQFPATQRPAQRPVRRRDLYVIIPVLFLVLALVFLTGRWLFFPGASAALQTRVGVNNHATPTSVLLTPATATSAQATATASVIAVQVPTAVPTPLPNPSATPDPVAIATPVPTAGPTPTPTPGNVDLAGVVPVLNCAMPQGFNQYLLKFGYKNNNSYAVKIPVGNNNNVYPSKINGTQPVNFSSGTQNQVFQIHVSGNELVMWTIDSHVAVWPARGIPNC